MRERDFEADLERMFREAPAMPDADLFAAGVQGRLDRAWALRRWGVAGAGAIGGVVAVTQTLGANLSLRLQDASAGSAEAVDTVYRLAGEAGAEAFSAFPVLDGGPTLFWIVSGLLVLLAAAAGGRVFDEL